MITHEMLDKVELIREGLSKRMNAELDAAQLALSENRRDDAFQHLLTFDNIADRMRTEVIMEIDFQS